jgi:hypothetical protein
MGNSNCRRWEFLVDARHYAAYAVVQNLSGGIDVTLLHRFPSEWPDQKNHHLALEYVKQQKRRLDVIFLGLVTILLIAVVRRCIFPLL